MGADPSSIRVLPNPRVTRTYGIFNIVFAILLMLCGLGYAVQMAFMPAIMKAMGQVQTDLKNRTEKAKADRIKSLDEEEKAATSEKSKARIAEERKAVQSSPSMPVTPMPDLAKMGLNDPKLQAWSWAEILTGLTVNVMLLVSGIGLLSCKPWAWKLAVVTAIVKIARLTLLYTAFVVAIVPMLATNMGKTVVEMMAAQQQMTGGGGPPVKMPPAELFIKVYSIMYSVMGVGMIVFGSIYPLILLWGLSRPGIRAACATFPTRKPAVDTMPGELS